MYSFYVGRLKFVCFTIKKTLNSLFIYLFDDVDDHKKKNLLVLLKEYYKYTSIVYNLKCKVYTYMLCKDIYLVLFCRNIGDLFLLRLSIKTSMRAKFIRDI